MVDLSFTMWTHGLWDGLGEEVGGATPSSDIDLPIVSHKCDHIFIRTYRNSIDLLRTVSEGEIWSHYNFEPITTPPNGCNVFTPLNRTQRTLWIWSYWGKPRTEEHVSLHSWWCYSTKSIKGLTYLQEGDRGWMLGDIVGAIVWQCSQLSRRTIDQCSIGHEFNVSGTHRQSLHVGDSTPHHPQHHPYPHHLLFYNI